MTTNPTTMVVHVNDPRFKDNPQAVYIGRACDRASDKRCHAESAFCNPYNIRRAVNETRANVIARFEALMRSRLGLVPVMNPLEPPELWRERLLRLDGKVLGWCSPEPCHGDVIIKLIQEIKERR